MHFAQQLVHCSVVCCLNCMQSGCVYVIVVCCAFAPGRGFKLAPVCGKLLAELALGKEPSYNLAPFAISRFPNSHVKPKPKL